MHNTKPRTLRMQHALATGLLLAASALQAQTASTEPAAQPADAEWQSLQSLYQKLGETTPSAPRRQALLRAAMRAMVQEADPARGRLFTREEYAELLDKMQFKGSIGMNVRLRDGAIHALTPLPQGPADRAGLRAGDEIVAIDGVALHQDIDLAVSQIRGPEGSRISLAVRRAGVPLAFTLQRQRPQSNSLSVTVARGVGVLTPGSFNAQTLGQLLGAMDQAFAAQAPQALLLDLRRNQGGLFEAALDLASVFLPNAAPVLSTQAADGSTSLRTNTQPEQRMAPDARIAALLDQLKTLPLTVLVDEETASGAEVVAAALRDNRRAALLGRVTQGNNAIQSLSAVDPHYVLRITTAHWLPPSGQDLDQVGLQPDVLLDSPDRKAALDAALDHTLSRR